jgi:predicted nuclease of predicted toxin-antitoxin system
LSSRRTHFKTLLDEGVPVSAGKVLIDRGHAVIYHHEALLSGSVDEVVCATAVHNEAILVAIDADMKRLAKAYGVTPSGDRFDRLSIIRLCCNEVLAVKRLEHALTLIEHEWAFAQAKKSRRMWVDVGPHFIRTHR